MMLQRDAAQAERNKVERLMGEEKAKLGDGESSPWLEILEYRASTLDMMLNDFNLLSDKDTETLLA
jgi:hypothetical protein